MRRPFTTLVVLCLVFGVNVAPVRASMDQCSTSNFCEWDHQNYSGGEFTQWPTSANDWNLFGIENDDESVWNRESKRTNVYKGSNWTEGVAYCVVPGGSEDAILDDRDNNGDSNYLSETLTTCSGYPTP